MPDLTPRQRFEDNMRPAHLLVRVYQLLSSNDQIASDGEMVQQLRALVQAKDDEDLLLVYTDMFLGLVRERAELPRNQLLDRSLTHLLRQAVVSSCTALETYLPDLLRANMPTVIRARGRYFLPPLDEEIKSYFKNLTFGLEEVLRLFDDPEAPQRISNKILGYVSFNYLSSKKGIHLTGTLLGIDKPWNQIAAHFGSERKEMMDTLEKTVNRRNDIVHRADRSGDDLGGEPQGISYVRTRQMVDTVDHICIALDELVTAKMEEFATVPDPIPAAEEAQPE